MKINKRMVSGNLDILRYMFPNYKLIYEPEDNPDTPCIYAGKLENVSKLISTYNEKSLDYIVYTRGQSEFNLKDRLILADIVFDKYNKVVPKYLIDIINDLDEDTFMTCIKTYWTTGKWLVKGIDDEKSFLDFVGVLNGSTLQMYKTFFEITKTTSPYILESSFLTFLLRAKEQDYEGIKGAYKRKLKMFTNENLRKSLNGLNKSLEYNIDNQELKLLNMIKCIIDNEN